MKRSQLMPLFSIRRQGHRAIKTQVKPGEILGGRYYLKLLELKMHFFVEGEVRMDSDTDKAAIG